MGLTSADQYLYRFQFENYYLCFSIQLAFFPQKKALDKYRRHKVSRWREVNRNNASIMKFAHACVKSQLFSYLVALFLSFSPTSFPVKHPIFFYPREIHTNIRTLVKTATVLLSIEARHAGSYGSMSASGSAGPGFNPRRGSKFSFENFEPRGQEGWRCTLSNCQIVHHTQSHLSTLHGTRSA